MTFTLKGIDQVIMSDVDCWDNDTILDRHGRNGCFVRGDKLVTEENYVVWGGPECKEEPEGKGSDACTIKSFSLSSPF